MNKSTLSRAAACLAAMACLPAAALACSSCGCTLNGDWAGQGLVSGTGWSVDLRHDFFVQDDLRRGTGRVDRGAIGVPADFEVQQKTINRNTTFTLDRGSEAGWGVAVQLPYVERYHATIVEGDTGISQSRSSSLGDLRIVGRYQGFSPEHNWGVQLGLKLPTGVTDVNFNGGPQAGQPLDRGLQPGTGSTDLLLGVYGFGSISEHVDYFAQALLQLPLRGKDQFKPGAGANLTVGVRYVSDSAIVPQLQLNARSERRESGANADAQNSGATLVYLSPGATLALGEQAKVFAFLQLPIHQRVNGIQLEPKASLSLGLHYSF